MKTPKEKLIDFYQKSSDVTKDFMESGEMQRVFTEIEDKYKLNEEESLVLQEESMAYLLKIISKDMFVESTTLVLRDRKPEEIERIINEMDLEILSFQ